MWELYFFCARIQVTRAFSSSSVPLNSFGCFLPPTSACFLRTLATVAASPLTLTRSEAVDVFIVFSMPAVGTLWHMLHFWARNSALPSGAAAAAAAGRQ